MVDDDAVKNRVGPREIDVLEQARVQLLAVALDLQRTDGWIGKGAFAARGIAAPNAERAAGDAGCLVLRGAWGTRYSIGYQHYQQAGIACFHISPLSSRGLAGTIGTCAAQKHSVRGCVRVCARVRFCACV